MVGNAVLNKDYKRNSFFTRNLFLLKLMFTYNDSSKKRKNDIYAPFTAPETNFCSNPNSQRLNFKISKILMKDSFIVLIWK